MGRIAIWGFLLLAAGLALPLSQVAPPSSDTVVVACAPLTSLDPLETSKIDDMRVLGALDEALTRCDPATGNPEPALAQGWDIAPDGRRWIFHLRPQARWSDGTAVLPAQVIEGLEQHRRLGSAFSELLAPVATITVDGQDLIITCHQPVPDLAARLALPVFAPRHPGLAPSADPTRHIGNGPMVCRSWVLRHRVDLVPNPTYDGPHPARGPVRLRIVNDPATALRLYLDGQLDVIPSLTSDTAGAIRRAGLPGLTQATGWGTEVYRIRAGAMTPAAAARLSAAIDRQALVQELLDGFGTPAQGLIPGSRHPGPAVDDRTAIPNLDLMIPAGRPDRLRVAEHLIATWREHLGATVRLVTLPATELAARERTRSYDLSRGSLVGDTTDPLGFLAAFTTGAGMNRTGWSDPTYDALVQAAAAPGTDRPARLEAAERRLLEAGVVIPLYHYAALMLVRPGVEGAAANPWELVHLSSLGRK